MSDGWETTRYKWRNVAGKELAVVGQLQSCRRTGKGKNAVVGRLPGDVNFLSPLLVIVDKVREKEGPIVERVYGATSNKRVYGYKETKKKKKEG